MKIKIKRINYDIFTILNNKNELIEFTREYIENQGYIKNKLERKILYNKNILINDCLNVLADDFIRIMEV